MASYGDLRGTIESMNKGDQVIKANEFVLTLKGISREVRKLSIKKEKDRVVAITDKFIENFKKNVGVDGKKNWEKFFSKKL